MQKNDTICKNCPMYQKMYSRTEEHEVFLGATNAKLIPLGLAAEQAANLNH